MNNKKGIIILTTVVLACAVGFIVSPLVNWPVDENKASGDIAKSSRFSRKTAAESLTNMEELLATDESYKESVVASYVIMKLRADQFGALVEASNEVAGDIPEFASVLKDMNDSREMVDNVCASLAQAGKDLDAALAGEERPELAQNTMNASLAYSALQKQNKLANRFIATTDEYLKKSDADERLKFVRDQWVDYQRQSAALEGDEKSAKELDEKGYLLTSEQSLNALAAFGEFKIAQTTAGFQLCNEVIGIENPLNEILAIEQMGEQFVIGFNAEKNLNESVLMVGNAERVLGQELATTELNEQASFALGEVFQLGEFSNIKDALNNTPFGVENALFGAAQFSLAESALAPEQLGLAMKGLGMIVK